MASVIDDRSGAPQKSSRSRFLVWLLGCVLLLVLGLSFYSVTASRRELVLTKETADEDWRDSAAVLYAKIEHIELGDVSVSYRMDRETGLMIGLRFSDVKGFEAYNDRIRELIRIHGLPSWSVKGDIPEAQDVIALLDSSALTEVTDFPYRPNAKIVLTQGGVVTFGNSSYGSPPGGLAIVSEKGGLLGVGSESLKVYTAKVGNTVIVRNGTEWVGVFSDDGREIASASRKLPKNALPSTESVTGHPESTTP